MQPLSIKNTPVVSDERWNLPLLLSPMRDSQCPYINATLSARTMTVWPPLSNLSVLHVWTPAGETFHYSHRTHKLMWAQRRTLRVKVTHPMAQTVNKKCLIFETVGGTELSPPSSHTHTGHHHHHHSLVLGILPLWEKLFPFWTTLGFLTGDDDSMGSPSFC